MRIYILTLHWVSNFGANLQAFSTFHYLKGKGHEVTMINYRNPIEEKEYGKFCSKVQNEEHEKFIQTHLKQTRKVESLNEISEIIKEEKPDYVIVGSDAVWIQKKEETLTPYWLNDDSLSSLSTQFVSLAISIMGTNIKQFPQWQKENIGKALNKFKSITLRDDWSLNQINEFTHQNALYSPDPVFLLEEGQLPPIQNKNLLELIERKEKYIIVSISAQRLYMSWFTVIKFLANRDGYKVVELPMPEGNHNIACDIRIELPLSPADWYRCIAHSQGYIGERFHAMVSCIHNHVPFIIIDTYGSKLPSLRNKRSKIHDLAKRINRTSYIIHKRNILLNSPHYIYQKLKKHIAGKEADSKQVGILGDTVKKHLNRIQ